ncbi:hypothetical protein BZG36_05143 [Bifiguratus adelaidae]|uniref:Uncharacterized protein n=1 Tax=Bifiguratus adelaidae TaxID=1938954 RepID=A0A261XVY2_9FUNG|nr:hypothetical protein BZG36_05143 [Bifiguratus adelaidae]
MSFQPSTYGKFTFYNSPSVVRDIRLRPAIFPHAPLCMTDLRDDSRNVLPYDKNSSRIHANGLILGASTSFSTPVYGCIFKAIASIVADMKVMASDSVVFTPALGQTVAVPAGTSTAIVYASSPCAVDLCAKAAGEHVKFEQINLDSWGEQLFTYKATFATTSLISEVSVLANNAELLGKISFVQSQAKGTEREFSTEILLEEGDYWKSQRIDWLDVHDWEGWAWYRPRETWIEASFTHLSRLSSQSPTHNLLLRPTNAEIDPSSVLAVFPASSQEAFVHLSASRNGEPPGVYARVRRVNKAGRIKVYVTGKLSVHSGTTTAIRGAIDVARAKYGFSTDPFVQESDQSPFDRLGFCTWSSIGENVPLTIDLMDNLVQLLRRDNVPISSFIIDDGWQDIRYGYNGTEKTRGLWSFGTWSGMKSNLSETVSLIKNTLPTVRDVGVWMTLAGYWNSIIPGSPLAQKYEMRMFKLNRDNVPGIHWRNKGFDGQQSGTITKPEDRAWCLPPPHLAYAFWKDYFSTCAEAGISFVKVDNQAYCSFLDGVEGGEEFVALWNGMTRAANEIFGENRVIHCMAHYERTFNGDIGMGAATHGKKIVIRNSDDFGLPRPNVNRDHIRHNIYNAMLTSQLCLIPDADMFMTCAQWPEYHAVLRAFFNGPVLLADKPGTWDSRVLSKLIGRSPENTHEVVRASQTVRPLARSVWEPFLGGGVGPSLKGASYLPDARSASIVLWNTRKDALDNSVDIIFEGDLVDALENVKDSLCGTWNGVIWASNARRARSVKLGKSKAYSDSGIIASRPLTSVSLEPQAVETLTIAPYHAVGSAKIATLGLIDKYAGLAAIKASQVNGDRLSTEIRFDGILGFLVACDVKALKNQVKVTIDDVVTDFSIEPQGEGLSLVQVDLTTAKAVLGKASWTVEIGI